MGNGSENERDGSTFADDVRGMTGGVIGMLFATVLVVSAVTAGIAAPSGPSTESASQEHVSSVAGGMRSSLADVNQGSSVAASDPVKAKMSSTAWEQLPPQVRSRLKAHMSEYIGQIEAQSGTSGKLTRIEPAHGADSVTIGTHLRQTGTGSHTVQKAVTETYTVEKTRTVRRQTGTKEVPDYEFKTVTKKRQVDTKRVRTVKPVAVKIPVFDTHTYTEWVERIRVIEVEKVTYHSHRECGIKWQEPVLDTVAAPHRLPYYTCWTEQHRHVQTGYRFQEYKVPVERTVRYVDHYETDIRLEVAWKEVPVYETYNKTVRIPNGTKTVPVYNDVTETYQESKTRTVTKNVSVSNAKFTYEGNADWTLATDVDGTRKATMTVQRSSLATDRSNALALRAVDTSGDAWTLHVWRDGQTVIVETSAGVHHEITAASVSIDLQAGTVNGADANLSFADGLDEAYELQFRNGDDAMGTFEFVIDGTSAVTSKQGITVSNDVIYEAVFDVTYTTQDTTYTDRIAIRPPLDSS